MINRLPGRRIKTHLSESGAPLSVSTGGAELSAEERGEEAKKEPRKQGRRFSLNSRCLKCRLLRPCCSYRDRHRQRPQSMPISSYPIATLARHDHDHSGRPSAEFGADKVRARVSLFLLLTLSSLCFFQPIWPAQWRLSLLSSSLFLPN